MSIGLFIDGAYVFKVYPHRMDYLKLRQHVEDDLKDEVDEGYFFNADDDPPRAQKLHNALSYPPPRGPGLRVKIYWLNRRQLWWPAQFGGMPVLHPDDENIQYEIREQKAVDVGLAFHLIRSFTKRGWDKLVLAAGDGDFHEPIQHLVEHENVDVYLIGSMSTISDKLRPYARKIYEIDKPPLVDALRLVVENDN